MRSVPGLYAIYADVQGWTDLGLVPDVDAALYIGKSEDNLVRRELDTHFAADSTKKPRTGSSTVRRSFAALLKDSLDLRAIPRNPANPGYFSNYGLTVEAGAQLTAWMHTHLSLTVWERPAGFTQPLAAVEINVIRQWMPPLNIRDNPRPLPRLSEARAVMTREASESQVRETYLAKPLAAVPIQHAPVPGRVATAPGLTPVELGRALGKNPKTIRQALRDKYGKLPVTGDRWGALTPEQESYIRARFR